MSLKNFSIAIGLSALGSLWVTPTCVEAQELPASAPPSPKAPAPTLTVLLLTNGRVLQGAITEDVSGTQYVYSAKNSGSFTFPKREVECAFVSMEELYQYKVNRLPKNEDPDERLKLAKWCLEQNLGEHAKEHLKVVLQLSPGYLPAERMIANIDATTENRRRSGLNADPEVARTSGEMPSGAIEDPKVNRARRDMMQSGGVPVIFDLPAPLAVRRATEFNKYVHPILQKACVRCHNESYNGSFQLVEARNNRELTYDLLRANLDATLPLINRDAPDRSELLVAALLPHGPSRTPILRGPTDRNYKTLSTWVQLLKATPPPPVAATGGQAPASGTPAAPAEEAFGSDRGLAPANPGLVPTRPPTLSPVPDPRSLMMGEQEGNPDNLASVLKNGVRNDVKLQGVSPAVPNTTQFPVSPLQGGGMPPLPAQPSLPKAGVQSAAKAPISPTATPAAPVDPAVVTSGQATTPAKSRPRKFDPALLEKVLKAKNQQPPQ